jgi:hypothetical protein
LDPFNLLPVLDRSQRRGHRAAEASRAESTTKSRSTHQQAINNMKKPKPTKTKTTDQRPRTKKPALDHQPPQDQEQLLAKAAQRLKADLITKSHSKSSRINISTFLETAAAESHHRLRKEAKWIPSLRPMI